MRSPEGACVLFSECEGYQCGTNQQYECGTECPDTCDNYDQNRVCIEICRYVIAFVLCPIFIEIYLRQAWMFLQTGLCSIE